MDQEKFNELWKLGMDHGAGTHFRWCARDQDQIAFQFLPQKNCCKCRTFILNGGFCDPL
jgi:hypothetical protein